MTGGFIMQNRREFLRLLGAGTFGAAALSVPISLSARESVVHVTILHTNDFHSPRDRFSKDAPLNPAEGGMARRAARLSKTRSETEAVHVVDAGDSFQ